MPAPKLTNTLRKEYNDLFDTCEVGDEHADDVAGIVHHILDFQERYAGVETTTGVPWFVVAVIHNLECGLSFNAHLHNGDPLTARTVNDPKGRPTKGSPTFDWTASALDALQYDALTSWDDWSVPGICYKLEGYNGWGYRSHGVHTPYLWSFSNHYTDGKYISDGVWSDAAISRQCGAAVILRRMAEKGQVALGTTVPVSPKLPAPATLAAVPFAMHPPGNPKQLEAVEDLQRVLSLFPGIFLKVDGIAGTQVSNAFQKITGHYLPGDPRA